MTRQPLPHFFLNWGFGSCATPFTRAQRGVLAGLSVLLGAWPKSWLCLSEVLLPVPVPGGAGGSVQDAAGSSTPLPQAALLVLPSCHPGHREWGVLGHGNHAASHHL